MSEPASTPIFVWKRGWFNPHGPFECEDAAREYAEDTARTYPNEIVHLLTSRTTVQTPALTPIWDDES